MKSYAYLFWGYTIFWIALASYLLWVVRRLLRAQRRLDELEGRERTARRER